MAKREKNLEPERLPIKLILPDQAIEKRIPGGGGKQEPFRTVDTQYRERLSNQVAAIQKVSTSAIESGLALPLRVKLIKKAIAKSHRPDQLFSSSTCPIVGAGNLGELFIKGTSQGLEKLRITIEENESKRVIKELSCIEAIEPITPKFRLGNMSSAELLRHSPRTDKGFLTRVQLFDLRSDQDQSRLILDFEKQCKKQKLEITSSGYSAQSFVYGVNCRAVEDVEVLIRVLGVRSVSSMPTIRRVKLRLLNRKPTPRLPSRGDIVGEVPTVVIVDSGISNNIPELESWVVGRETQVAEPYRNNEHGTFVAGLICFGDVLNPTVAGLDSNPCSVFDLQLIPNYDPEKGDTDSISEQEFLVSLDMALQRHANEYKVWNLSLGTDTVCSLDRFSSFAIELDNLQEKYEVSFVISAGNYVTAPLLNYPRTGRQLDLGRITSPADSILGVTVGSISHVAYSEAGPKINQPSPFSRHGAGPNYIIKPDVVHYGGSCSTSASHISGIRSITEKGSEEDIGTSFSTPLVSRTLAQIYHQITPTPKPVLAKAILTHHARDPRTNHRVPDGEEDCFGFGLPASVPYCLECTPYTSTLVFDDVLRPGWYLEWNDFPYPTSLSRNGRFFGEIWMTIAFSPSRGSQWGSEYCETHIDASFGVYRKQVSRETGATKIKFVGLVPPEHRNRDVLLYETYQVRNLRKWAAVRTYYGDLGENGESGENWRLKVRLLTRHAEQNRKPFNPQPFSLIITISDPLKKASVYDEMARSILNRFQYKNLALRPVARVRVN